MKNKEIIEKVLKEHHGLDDRDFHRVEIAINTTLKEQILLLEKALVEKDKEFLKVLDDFKKRFDNSVEKDLFKLIDKKNGIGVRWFNIHNWKVNFLEKIEEIKKNYSQADKEGEDSEKVNYHPNSDETPSLNKKQEVK